MSTELFDERFRLRRRGFPRLRPKDGPFGFAGGVGWLAPGLLWIDGWLSIDPVAELAVGFSIGGHRLRRSARCFVAPPFAVAGGGLAARRWVLVVPVGSGFETASRLHGVALDTPWGELQWLGACDRLIKADVVEHLREPKMPAHQIASLRSFLESAVLEAGGDADDVTFRRNLSALRETVEPEPPALGAAPAAEVECRTIATLGSPPARPQVSVIVTLLEAPDLLEHHFAQLRRSRGDLATETIFVVGPGNASLDLHRRAEVLADLYDLPGRVVELGEQVRWATAAGVGARQAHGDVLAFYQEHTFTFETAALASLVRPLFDDPAIGITAPVVSHFDGTVRSRGFRIAGDGSGTDVVEALRPLAADEPEPRTIDACSSECFAVRRDLFASLGGFSGSFAHHDFETIDLCLRAAAAGAGVHAVATQATRLIEHAAQAPLTLDRPAARFDRETLRRRHVASRPAPSAAEGAGPGRPSVTVVIPTLEPGRELAEVLDRIEGQEGVDLVQVLVIDSSSRDGTRSLLRRRGTEHRVIARREFNHGLTRNLGVEHARGDVVAFLSQDALPEPGWLAELVEPFADPGVAGAYSRQVPRTQASPFSLDRLANWPATAARSRRQVLPSIRLIEAMSLGQRLEMICFDNVASAVRRSVALEIPFRDLPFGEDRDWAYRAMAAGYAVEYRCASRVLHSHDRSSWADLKRTVVDHRLIQEMLGSDDAVSDVGVRDLLPVLQREVYRLLDIASRSPGRWRRLRFRAQVPGRAAVGVLGAHLGARVARLGAAGSRKWSWLGRLLTG